MADTPTYYTRGRLPVWDFIRQQGLNFHRGNAIKYICRAGYKDNEVEDLKKAIHYLENELQHATLHKPSIIGSGNAIPFSIWDEEWDEQSDYATGFDR